MEVKLFTFPVELYVEKLLETESERAAELSTLISRTSELQTLYPPGQFILACHVHRLGECTASHDKDHQCITARLTERSELT